MLILVYTIKAIKMKIIKFKTIHFIILFESFFDFITIQLFEKFHLYDPLQILSVYLLSILCYHVFSLVLLLESKYLI